MHGSSVVPGTSAMPCSPVIWSNKQVSEVSRGQGPILKLPKKDCVVLVELLIGRVLPQKVREGQQTNMCVE